MKKICKSIMATLCAVMLLGSLTACQAESAYDLAVKNGFKGTQAEWLESLHGSDGKDGEDGKDVTAKDLYETAQKNGFTGTFLEFCRDVLQIEVKTDNDLDQIAQNITSVVSIYCGFISYGHSRVFRDIESGDENICIRRNLRSTECICSGLHVSQSFMFKEFKI